MYLPSLAPWHMPGAATLKGTMLLYYFSSLGYKWPGNSNGWLYRHELNRDLESSLLLLFLTYRLSIEVLGKYLMTLPILGARTSEPCIPAGMWRSAVLSPQLMLSFTTRSLDPTFQLQHFGLARKSLSEISFLQYTAKTFLQSCHDSFQTYLNCKCCVWFRFSTSL